MSIYRVTAEKCRKTYETCAFYKFSRTYEACDPTAAMYKFLETYETAPGHEPYIVEIR